MMTPLAFARDYIARWEDGGSTDPNKTHSLRDDDPGNYQSGKLRVGPLVGSNHGVTAPALAAYRKVPVTSITREVMHALTLDEAAQIALALYYVAPKFDRLPWDATIASVFDFGWGAGPGQAAKTFQRMLSLSPDGAIGPVTVAAYIAFAKRHGAEETARLWADQRFAFYQSLNQPQFLKGWGNRTRYFEPESEWWGRFNA